MQSIEMVTALALGGIVAILALYVLVIYKKGWLRGNSKGSRNYYLCPNTKCRKVFREPVWLTDLSTTPPESFQSCPHCGTNLQTSPSFSSRTEIETKTILHSQSSGGGGDNKSQDMIDRQLEINGENVDKTYVQKPALDSKQIFPKSDTYNQPSKPGEPKPSIKTVSTKTSPHEAHSQTIAKPIPSVEKHEEKKPSAVPKNCKHYLGYVKTLPKSTPIPDECMWCTSIVKCLTGTEKIEA